MAVDIDKLIDNKKWLSLKDSKRMKAPCYDDQAIAKNMVPEAQIRQKMAKNRNWFVCSGYIDPENKKFVYKCMLNPNETVERSVTFDEVCKDMHWKSFKFSDNWQSIKFVKDPEWDATVEKVMAEQAKLRPAEEPDTSKKTEWRMKK